MCKRLINSRFKEIINHLIDNKIELTKGNIAKKMGITSQKFTEILNGRMNVGTDLLASIAKNYSFFSLHWLLLGEGSMLNHTEFINIDSNINENDQFNRLLNKIQELTIIIHELKKENNLLKEENHTLKDCDSFNTETFSA